MPVGMKDTDRYDSLLQYWCRPDLDWLLAKAQMMQESGGNPTIVNKYSGATGLMQFMKQTWREWWDGTPGIQAEPPAGSITDPECAIRRRCDYMRWLLTRHHGNMDEALAAYNWGTGNVRTCIAHYGSEWRLHLPKETADYVTRIKQRRIELEKYHGTHLST